MEEIHSMEEAEKYLDEIGSYKADELRMGSRESQLLGIIQELTRIVRFLMKLIKDKTE